MRWFIAIALAAVLPLPARADPTVFVSPASTIVQEGEAFELGIRVDAGTDTLTCFLVAFEFDADVIELTSAAEGTLFAECGYSTMFDWDVSGPGSHSCNDVTLGYWAYAICPGELVHLEFEAVSWGETPVQITLVDLRDIRRHPILPVGTADGLVTVEPAAGVGEDEPGGAGRLSVAPNPFSIGATIALERAPASGRVELSIYDVSGRLAARRDLGCGYGGSLTAEWDGSAVSGVALPSGVYFAVLRGPGWERRASLVLLR